VTLQIAPSLLSADFARLGSQIEAVERGGADLLHLDVMDGHFVPNLTMGPMVARAVRRVTQLPIDVHLMVQEPDRFLEAFAEAGATMMSVHVEAAVHLQRTTAAIKALGCRAGAVLNPATPVGALEEIASDLDYVLVMSVNPGFGGQAFLPRSESKVRAVRMLLDAHGSGAAIEIDGGIDTRTAGRVVAAGARILVAGAAIFTHPDPEAATRELRAAAAARLTA
jgi:ribulose-phosphate 3-epimerase